jgi:excisionase family DNA binding protein
MENSHTATHGPNTASAELLTITEACAFLKIKRRTLDDWRNAKALPCIERGRWIRFRRSDLDAFLSAHTVQPRTAPAYRLRVRAIQQPTT